MTIEQLTQYAKEFLAENYGLAFDIPIEINRRLRRSQGVYNVSGEDDAPLSIELAGFLMDYGTQEAVKDTLKHELIHHAMHVTGKRYSDGDDDFENELCKYDVGATETKLVGKHFLSTCDGCGKRGETNVRRTIISPERYSTRCCGTSYTYVGHVIYDGYERKEFLRNDKRKRNLRAYKEGAKGSRKDRKRRTT